MFCPNCGAKNDDDATFCSSCGSSLQVAAGATAASPTPPVGGVGRVTGVFKSAIALTRSPADYMKQNNRGIQLKPLMTGYVAILALIPLVATLIGDLWYYSHEGAGFAVGAAISSYVLEVIGVVILGFIIWKLGPSFGTTTDQARATTLAAYSYTPFFLLTILDIIPPVAVVTVLAVLYGIYIVYLGLPIMLGTPTGKVVPYVVVTLVIELAIFFIFALIIGVVSHAAAM